MKKPAKRSAVIRLSDVTRLALEEKGVEIMLREAFGELYEVPMHINAIDNPSRYQTGWQLRFNRVSEKPFSKYLSVTASSGRSHEEALEQLSELLMDKIESGQNVTHSRINRGRDNLPFRIGIAPSKKELPYYEMRFFLHKSTAGNKSYNLECKLGCLGSKYSDLVAQAQSVHGEWYQLWRWRKNFIMEYGLDKLEDYLAHNGLPILDSTALDEDKDFIIPVERFEKALNKWNERLAKRGLDHLITHSSVKID